MFNSYRFAVVLMLLFGAVGIQAARYQANHQIAGRPSCADRQQTASAKEAIPEAQPVTAEKHSTAVDVPVSRTLHLPQKDTIKLELAGNRSL